MSAKSGRNNLNSPLSSPKCPEAFKRRKQNFYGRDFAVEVNRTLIPRPETEQIIDLVLTLAGKSFLPGVKAPKRVLPENPVIVDVGTGSGCIAITLALELPNATIYGVDTSTGALKVASKNLRKYQVNNARVFISNLLSNPVFTPQKRAEFNAKLGRFGVRVPDYSKIDLVVANLPYVDKNWDWLDLESLSFEPAEALFAGDHGLALIKKLINQVSERKIKHLILEADPCQHAEIIAYAKNHNLKHVETRGFILYFSA